MNISIFPIGARVKDFLIFSNIARLTYVIIVCIIVGFVVPLILNETGVFDYAPPNNDVPATCRILEGVRWVKRDIPLRYTIIRTTR